MRDFEISKSLVKRNDTHDNTESDRGGQPTTRRPAARRLNHAVHQLLTTIRLHGTNCISNAVPLIMLMTRYGAARVT